MIPVAGASVFKEGKTTTFKNYILEAVDDKGNCLPCDAHFTTSAGMPVIIYPASNEIDAINCAANFNQIFMQEYGDTAPPTYAMKRVPLHRKQSIADEKQVNALLSRFTKQGEVLTVQQSRAAVVTVHMDRKLQKQIPPTLAAMVAKQKSSQITISTDL